MASDGFRTLDEKSLIDYIKATPSLAAKLGNQFDNLQLKEVGDGNMNFVYIIIGSSGSIVVKQVALFFFFFLFWGVIEAFLDNLYLDMSFDCVLGS